MFILKLTGLKGGIVAQFLFVTDLDNTFVGDDQALAILSRKLVEHRTQHGTVIVYSTGRSLTLYRELEQEKSLIQPDILVLSVGTEIYHTNAPEPDPDWSQHLSHGWDREAVVEITAHFADLEPQPDTEQTPFKASYFLHETVAADLIPQLKAALGDRGLDAQVIYSSGQDLDILPRRANKGAATTFLQQKLNIAPEKTVVCGDSGNDLSLFQDANSRGVIVGNARPELLDWHHANPSGDRYLAQARCAGGILEGLHYFGFLA
jgi:sucrose-6F-phosphate phosphohydrolase